MENPNPNPNDAGKGVGRNYILQAYDDQWLQKYVYYKLFCFINLTSLL